MNEEETPQTTPVENQEPPKHPGGRPSKYDPAFCAKVIEVGIDGGTLYSENLY